MDQNPVTMTVTTVGIAGGAALLAPVAAPALHGIAGIAVVGLGAYASGSAFMNATAFLNEKVFALLGEGADTIGVVTSFLSAKPKKRVLPKEIPFKKTVCQGGEGKNGTPFDAISAFSGS